MTTESKKNVEDKVETPLQIDDEKKKEPEQIQNEISTIETKSSPSIEVQSQNNAFSNLSSMELIFLGYAKQLQKMPLKLQLKTKRKIADIMDEAELEMMS